MKETIKFSVISLSIIIATGFTIFIVNLPAISEKLELNTTSANIGNAIGGIATLTVGICNIYMLYLAFKVQRTANGYQSDAIKNEKEKNESALKEIIDTQNEIRISNEINILVQKCDNIFTNNNINDLANNNINHQLNMQLELYLSDFISIMNLLNEVKGHKLLRQKMRSVFNIYIFDKCLKLTRTKLSTLNVCLLNGKYFESNLKIKIIVSNLGAIF